MRNKRKFISYLVAIPLLLLGTLMFAYPGLLTGPPGMSPGIGIQTWKLADMYYGFIFVVAGFVFLIYAFFQRNIDGPTPRRRRIPAEVLLAAGAGVMIFGYSRFSSESQAGAYLLYALGGILVGVGLVRFIAARRRA